MKAVLPGRPEARLQALSTGYWDDRRIIVYITGNALAILSDPDTLLQAIYDDDERKLDAVAFDESSGKIAASTGATIRVYRPMEAVDDALKWALQTTFEIDDDHVPKSLPATPTTLSWGSSEELLIGGATLMLYNTASTPATCHWWQRLASPAKTALLSHDSSYIASVGYHDRLVKVWRRLNFGFEEVHFELGYLSHPRAVVAVQWRKPSHPRQTVDENILYTFCADGVARVWTGADGGAGHHGRQHGYHSGGYQSLRLWGQVDLVQAIRSVPGYKHHRPKQVDGSREEPEDDGLRWAFIISQRDLANATERAVQERAEAQQGEDVALQYLLSIANRDTEICVVLDGRGSMSAWALENVSAKTTATNNIDNVAFVKSKDFEFLGPSSSSSSPTSTKTIPPPYVEILNYCNKAAGNLNLLIHRVDDGRVELFETGIADLLDPTSHAGGRPRPRLAPRATWSGHSASIKKIVRNYSGRAIVSRTQQGGECIVWKHGTTLTAPGHGTWQANPEQEDQQHQHQHQHQHRFLGDPKLIPEKRHIHRISLIRGGNFVIFLHHESIAVWDCRSAVPVLMAERPYDLPGKPLCILVLPRQNRDDVSVAHIATITSERKGAVWEVHLPLPSPGSDSGRNHPGASKNRNQVNGHKEAPVLEEFCTFTLGDAAEDLAYVLPVDPAGASPAVSLGFLDIFTRDVAISYTPSGRVEFWTARVVGVGDPDPRHRQVEWLATATADTGIAEPSLVSGSTMKKAALVNRDRSAVSIWDVRNGARLEYYALEGKEQEHVELSLDLGDTTAITTTTTVSTTTTTTHTTTTSSPAAPVQDLDWTSTPDSQSILAVGYPYRIVLLPQLRFDYLNRGPAWAPLREINIRELTPHPIGDSCWLGSGHLVVGAGNQFFVYDRLFVAPTRSSAAAMHQHYHHRRPRTAPKGGSGGGAGAGSGGSNSLLTRDLFDVVQRLNGPLPVFHPQFLSQCILAARNAAVKRVLLALHHALKFHAEGDEIDDYLGLDLAEFYNGGEDSKVSARTNGSKGRPGISFDDGPGYENEDEDVFSEDVAATICEKLQHIALPQLSAHEQIQLVDIVECAGVVERQRRSMDENGARFMLFFRQHALLKYKAGRAAAARSHHHRRNVSTASTAFSASSAPADGSQVQHHNSNSSDAPPLSWREITWAFHSSSQDVLADFVTKQYHGSMLWENARECGIFMWLSDANAVKAQFEVIARNEYTKSEVKNPVDCSLFYLALRKKAVLQGLWRMATWNKEQTATQRLLSNNFADPKWKTTALKNAYALLSKRRFEYAAAFFLLADHLQDAVNVCLNQIGDMQLAVAVARVYEGDHGPVLKKLLEEEVLAFAAREGNRWLASWAFWMLGRRDMAVRALITPVYTLLETPFVPDPKSKLFLADDPALVVLYSQLRGKTLQTLRGASKVTPRTEWEFVLHNARLYDRMGCDLLGLELVRNWEFLRQPPPHAAPFGDGDNFDPRKLLHRGSSLVIADLPVSPTAATAVQPDTKKTGTGTGAAANNNHNNNKPKPPPTVFEEPDANALLDSFGF